jgi:branched-chain amino acid transport system substrate-binding protein
VKFVYADDQSSPQVALQLVNGLIAKHVAVIVGPTGVANCNAIAPAVKDGPVVYCLSPGYRPQPGGTIFAAGVGPSELQIAETRYLRERGLKRIALIATTDGAGQDYDRTEADALALPENKDMSVVAHEHFAPTDVTVGAQMARIKAANPQVLVVLCSGTPMGTVLRSIRDAGLEIPVIIPPANATYAQMKQYESFLPKELFFPNEPFNAPDSVTDRGVKDALRVYFGAMNAMGVKPDVQATGWDAGLIVATALKKVGANATSEQLRDAIASTQGLAGTTGRYDFKAVPQRGVGVDAVIVQRWDAARGTWVAVSKPGGALR